MLVTKRGWLPVSLTLLLAMSGYTMAELPKNTLMTGNCDNEQDNINRSQQLYAFSEGRSLAKLNDVDSALKVMRGSLDSMKKSCEVNPYELSDELKVISYLLAQKRHYAEAQQLWEDALPLAEFDQFTKGFLLSAVMYAHLANDSDSELRLINTLLFVGENGVKPAPDLWQIDTKNNRLTDQLAKISYPLVSQQGWLLVRLEPARKRADRTTLAYFLPSAGSDGTPRFANTTITIFYKEPEDIKVPADIKTADAPISPSRSAGDNAEKNKLPAPFDVNQLPDFISKSINQVKSVKVSDDDGPKIISANWEIVQGDWHITVNSEFLESDSQAALKQLTGLFSEIKWETVPKLYHQQTMKSIDNALEAIYLRKGASAQEWDNASQIAQNGLSEAAFPVEYEKLYNIVGINDYLHGRFADALAIFQKSMSLDTYTNSDLNDGYNYETTFLYAAHAARQLGKTQESSELISRYIELKSRIKDKSWSVDASHNLIKETAANGLTLPLIMNEFNVSNAAPDEILYSPIDVMGVIQVQAFSEAVTLQQYIQQDKGEAERWGFDKSDKPKQTNFPIANSKKNAVRWSVRAHGPAEYPQDKVYWFIPYQGKLIVLNYRSSQPDKTDSEKLDAFAQALIKNGSGG